MDPLEAISQPTRRRIVARIAELGEASVNDIAAPLDITRPAVSQHLKVLRESGVVLERKVGRHRLHRLNPEGLAQARAEIELFLVNELDDLETAARQIVGSRSTNRTEVVK
ncbi:MAG: metalloregulator ArsR/SmtB family transcription factor [Acidimicrobiia bacterium]|nr:metalloregulator ArsR/SmtB family transcription factor [Acidimicrobiia bacterium]